MRPTAPLAAALVLVLFLAGCTSPQAPAADDGPGRTVPLESVENVTVYLDTTLGEIAIEMLANKSQVTVANFLQYATSGFYDGTIFHRTVVKSNESCIGVVQGGGFTANLKPKAVNLGPIPLERPRNLSHVEGTVAMARTDEEHTATTQFFINVEDSSCLDRAGYAIFGRVVRGLDVAKAIQKLPTVAREAHTSVPHETVTIQKARVGYPLNATVAIDLASLHEGYKIGSTGKLAFPVLVKNVGTMAAVVSLAAAPSDPSIEAAFDRPSVTVAPGEWLPVILRLNATGASTGVGNVTVDARAHGATARHVVPFRIADPAGPATDLSANGRAKVAYVGLYGNAAVFDSNIPLPKNVRVFPSNNRPQFEPLAVWLGDDAAPAGYITVIPGFRDAALGLRVGETTAVRLDPAQAYRDGHERLFEVTILSIDPPT